MKKLLTLTLISLTLQGLFAQQESKLTISGSVDTYAQNYVTAPADSGSSFGTAFAEQAGFAFGMGNIIASYEGEKTGVVLDLVTGPRGAGATFNTDIVDGIVNQAYVYWNVTEKATLTFGRWNTFLGYEVIAPAANFNYSCSYLFSNGPFSHMGLKADFAFTDDVSLMLAVTNPWDTNDISTTGEYALGAQLGLYGQYFNVYSDSGLDGGLGLEVDYTGGFDLFDSFYLGINAAYNDNDGAGFYGAALYPQFSLSDTFAVGLRGEYFGLHGGEDEESDDPSVVAFTLTGSYVVDGNLIIKPELRLDTWSESMPYLDKDGMPSEKLSAVTLAAIYSF
jgi:hypothetical protein